MMWKAGETQMRRNAWALVLALGLTVGTALPAGAVSFTDVPSGAWYAGAVGTVSDAGLMNGTTETTFSPDAQVTRGMVAAVLWRMAGSPEPQESATFADVGEGDYYARAVAWAQEEGIASGLGDGSFGGESAVTREQLSLFLYRYAQYARMELASGVMDLYDDAEDIHDWARVGMAHAVGAGLITGNSDGLLDPGGTATRAQLAVILQRMMTPAAG